MTSEGMIVKALSGFYYVDTGSSIVETKARGKFKRDALSPLVGDRVRISCTPQSGVIEEILPRRNSFVRPAVANIDAMVIFCSNVNPVTDPFLVDRMTVINAFSGIESIICVNKTDLESEDRISEIYQLAGFRVVRTSTATGEGIDLLLDAIRGKTVAFAGNSGAGKTSILNCLNPELSLPVGEVSEKLGRGKHTTRHVQLYPVGGTTYIADTPGFSSYDPEQIVPFSKQQLQYLFPDFAPFLGNCRFADCLHGKEPGCAVREAVGSGKLQPSRYASYLRMTDGASGKKEWELRDLTENQRKQRLD